MSIDEQFEATVKAISRIKRGPKFTSAYEAGYDSALNGANTENCHFGWFTSPSSTREWERGKADGEKRPAANGGRDASK